MVTGDAEPPSYAPALQTRSPPPRFRPFPEGGGGARRGPRARSAGTCGAAGDPGGWTRPERSPEPAPPAAVTPRARGAQEGTEWPPLRRDLHRGTRWCAAPGPPGPTPATGPDAVPGSRPCPCRAALPATPEPPPPPSLPRWSWRSGRVSARCRARNATTTAGGRGGARRRVAGPLRPDAARRPRGPPCTHGRDDDGTPVPSPAAAGALPAPALPLPALVPGGAAAARAALRRAAVRCAHRHRRGAARRGGLLDHRGERHRRRARPGAPARPAPAAGRAGGVRRGADRGAAGADRGDGGTAPLGAA